MNAYHSDPAIKQMYLGRVEAHRRADEMIQGYGYWKNGKGCAVGCTIHGDSHASYETELGIPRAIAHLEDGIFEGLTAAKARTWPSRFLDAIPIGADLSGVVTQFLYWLLMDETDGVICYATTTRTRDAISGVGTLLHRKSNGGAVTADEWRNARSAAVASAYAASASADAYAASYAAAYAAYAAASVASDAAASAASDASVASAYAASASADAYAASYAAAYAAYAAASVASAYAASASADAYAAAYAAASTRQKSRVKQSEKLLELLAAAPVEVSK